MLKTFAENVRGLFASSEHETYENRTRVTPKRKREEFDEDDPDVQIIKIEKRRKVEDQSSQSVFKYIKQSVTAMASWMNPKSKYEEKLFRRQSDASAEWTTVASRRNGGRRPHSALNGDDKHHQNHKPFHRDTPRCAPSLSNPQPSRTIPIQRMCSRSSDSSSSSIFGKRKMSTASACIRLQEKHEYQRLIQLQTQSALRSPWQIKVTEHDSPRFTQTREKKDSDAISVCSGYNTSILGMTNNTNFLPKEPHKNFEPHKILKKTAPCNVSRYSPVENSWRSQTAVNRSYTPAFPIYTPAPVLSSDSDQNNSSNGNSSIYSSRLFGDKLSTDAHFQDLLATQRRRRSVLKSVNQSMVRSTDSVPVPIVVKHSPVDSKPIVIEDESENSRTSPAIVIDDEEEKNQSSQAQACSSKMSEVQKNKSRPDFLNSIYIRDSYLDDLNSTRSLSSDERRRQIEEQDLKAKAYAEKRRVQERSLENQMKYKMKIFDEEPEVLEEIFITDDEEEEESLPELTSEMEQQIASALRPGQPGQILSEAFRLQITRKDIATLGGLNWLNDEIINFYMNMLMERGEREGNAKVYAFNTFFYPKIMSGGHQAVRRWTKKVDIFAMNYIIIPVHLGMHWCLCVANIKDQVITYYDSMGGRNMACVEAVRKYVNDESVAKRQTGINMSEWQLVIEQDIPQQMNGSDCGMFTCKYAEYITRGKPITFTQEDMPYFRRRMVYEILTKQLMQ